jgi:pyruvate dehydrogenase E1 component
LPEPAGDPFTDLCHGTGDKVKASTTSALTRLLRNLMKDRQIGKRIVPIIPDEGRTFGLDALFATSKIYAPFGQKYEPVDANLVLSYREDRTGQILEEGITEAGSMASFTAAGTAYATWGQPMIPFYIFYSMFGFQRVGDLIWAFGDARGRGFLLGATAGRTTLQGEGLQHDDGHSPALASTVPNCRVYDPAFAYELAVIVEDGIRRMYGEKPEDCFYYITLYNETYPMPAMPSGARDGILRGLYRYLPAPEPGRSGMPPESPDLAHRARILASGSAMMAAVEAQQLLAEHHDVAAEVWSATSYKALREDALSVERWNRLHPTEVPRVPWVTHALGAGGNGWPVVAVTDYMKVVPDQIARWVPGPFIPLGTDGYGFSDTRAALRRHFETDAAHIVVAVLHGLAEQGEVKAEAVAEAIRRYDIDPEAVDPREA